MENKKKRRAEICAAPYRQTIDAAHSESNKQQQPMPHKLLARATQINNSLLVSLNAVLDAKVAIDADTLACKELACELTNWDRALAELEAAIVANLPKKGGLSTETKPGPLSSEKRDNDKSANHALLQTIKLQKDQIGALENRLSNLLRNQAAPVSDTEDSREKTAAAESGAQSNRVLIAIARSGNLKYPISRNVMTIGRQPTNDIHIRSRYLSRLHARIVSEKKGAFIEDLDSANGVIVNSRRVRRCLLRSGDRITLGKTQMQYIDIEEDSEDSGQA